MNVKARYIHVHGTGEGARVDAEECHTRYCYLNPSIYLHSFYTIEIEHIAATSSPTYPVLHLPPP